MHDKFDNHVARTGVFMAAFLLTTVTLLTLPASAPNQPAAKSAPPAAHPHGAALVKSTAKTHAAASHTANRTTHSVAPSPVVSPHIVSPHIALPPNPNSTITQPSTGQKVPAVSGVPFNLTNYRGTGPLAEYGWFSGRSWGGSSPVECAKQNKPGTPEYFACYSHGRYWAQQGGSVVQYLLAFFLVLCIVCTVIARWRCGCTFVDFYHDCVEGVTSIAGAMCAKTDKAKVAGGPKKRLSAVPKLGQKPVFESVPSHAPQSPVE